MLIYSHPLRLRSAMALYNKMQCFVECPKNLTARCICKCMSYCAMIFLTGQIYEGKPQGTLFPEKSLRAVVCEYMLTKFLSSYAVLYLMLFVCILGVIGKFIASRRCARLSREAGDLILARDVSLKQLRVRFESAYRLNHGQVDTQTMVRCHMEDYRFLGMNLEKLVHADRAAALLCITLTISALGYLFVGGANIYICMRIFSWGLSLSLATLFFGALLSIHTLSNVCDKLIDYLEHSLSARLLAEQERKSSASAHGGMRDDLFMQKEEPIETGLRVYQDPLSEIAATIEEDPSIRIKRQLADMDDQMIIDILRQYLDEKLS